MYLYFSLQCYKDMNISGGHQMYIYYIKSNNSNKTPSQTKVIFQDGDLLECCFTLEDKSTLGC